METIYVEIACYRDAECPRTIRDLFQKALHPERIFVGVCWQFIPQVDQRLFRPLPRPAQIRSIGFDARESIGVGWARQQAHSLWDGEDYALTIDSHMRFAPGWDVALIEMLKKCPSDKPVLSTYPAPYHPPEKLVPMIPHIVARGFEGEPPMLEFGSITVKTDSPKRGAFVAGGFAFRSSHAYAEVPHDPYIYFTGEEISLAVRYWSWGWDVFSPHRCVIHHYYTRAARVRPWEDNSLGEALEKISVDRVHHLLGVRPSECPTVTLEMNELYGLGPARSLSAFEEFAGVDFKTQTISARARSGEFGG